MDGFHHLSPDLVMDSVESLGYRCDARILELNSYENRVYQIGIEDAEPLIGKFYRPGRWSDEQILEEHQFTLDLAAQDLSVVAPLDKWGQTLFNHGDYRFALYPRRGGRAPNLDNLDDLEILGRHVGKIHAESHQRLFQFRPTVDVESYGHAAKKFLLEASFIPEELLPAYTSLSEQILHLLDERFAAAAGVKHIRLHGDCHMGNVLWRDGIPHFVDFDDARNGPPIQDLWMMLSGERNDQTVQLDTILEGYRTFCEFDLSQLQLIEPLRTLRMMHHSAWLAARWNDPAFPRAFPFFNTLRYWSDHILELREQFARLQEPSLSLYA